MHLRELLILSEMKCPTFWADNAQAFRDKHMTMLYRIYIFNSVAWRRKKEAVRERSNNICENPECVSRHTSMVQVHHTTYKNLFNEELDDLKLLCDSCHKKVHKLSGSQDGRGYVKLGKVLIKVIEKVVCD